MSRSSFGLTSLWGSLAMLSLCGTASAQWYSGSSSSCGCSAPSYMGSPPIIRSMASAFGAAPMSTASYAYSSASSSSYGYGDVECGAPIACHIEQPVVQQMVHVQAAAPVHQVVAVQQLQPVHHPIMQTVQATEYRPVKQTIQKPVVTTEYVDQAVTVMSPVSELKTVNVPTTEYQTVTEYKTVKKNVGYWVTKNVSTNKMSAYQYDNRPNMAGAMNRATYNMRTAFTPPYQQVRQYVPQTMTCTVPCKRQVAVQGMKQVTYNVTTMQPTQTTRKVAVNKVTYQTAEVTVMQPYQVTKTVQVGTKVAYVAPSAISTATTASAASNNCNSTTSGSSTALSPTPDPTNSSAVKPRPERTAEQNKLDPNQFDNRSGAIEPYDPAGNRVGDASAPAKKFVATSKPESAPSATRATTWVARNQNSTKPQPSGKSQAISIADSTR